MTAINVFTVAPENQARLVALLRQATESSIRHVPGFVAAALHRSLDGTRVTMYAQWRTPEDYARMRARPDASPFLAEALTIAQFEPGFYEVTDVFAPDTAELAPLTSVLVGEADPEIVELEARLRIAQLRGDVEALDELIAERLLFTGPDGAVGTKAQDIAAHRSGAIRIREHDPTELRARRVGHDMVVTALRARLAVEVAGELVRGTYCYTRVWAREDDRGWRVIGGHVSAVPDE